MNPLKTILGLKWRLKHVGTTDLLERFEEQDFKAIQDGCLEWAREHIYHYSLQNIAKEVREIWAPPCPKPEDSIKFTLPGVRYSDESALRPNSAAPQPATPEITLWLIGMTKQFMKDIQQIDRKLQGRVLEAITDLCRSPTTPRGDTVKPLTGERKSLWRYRLGDFRLIYLPDETKRNVTLVAFASRGTIYN